MSTEQSVAPVANVKTRAQITRDSVEIRLAVDEAGPLIAEILKENGVVLEGAKWDSVFPHWLLATCGDEAIGCCQVLVAKPVGFVEFLFVRKSVPFKVRALAIRKLMLQSIATLHLHGCSYAGCLVATKNFKFANVIEKLNAVKMYQADVWAKRVN